MGAAADGRDGIRGEPTWRTVQTRLSAPSRAATSATTTDHRTAMGRVVGERQAMRCAALCSGLVGRVRGESGFGVRGVHSSRCVYVRSGARVSNI